ncbi:MAG: MoaD/ThiS family protein [Lentisphaeraceae bacterium]|nr:MoaD/ThiS family protein [Lentisphaeraceae bacterium]
MIFKIKLWGQLKQLNGDEFRSVELTDKPTIENLLNKLAVEAQAISHFLVDEKKTLSTSILVFINGNQHVWGTAGDIKESDEITLMSPIAGG